jgi:hypothetical protein
MPPVDGAPEWSVRIILKEQMILALPEDRSVGIVHPIARSNKVIERAVTVSRQGHPQLGKRRID